MTVYLDTSVIVAALLSDQAKHAECLELLSGESGVILQHGLLETFSTMPGGRLGFRVDAEVVTDLLSCTVLVNVDVIELTTEEFMTAFGTLRNMEFAEVRFTATFIWWPRGKLRRRGFTR